MASISVPCPKVVSLVRVGSNGQTSKNQQNQLAFGSSLRQSSLSMSRLPRREEATACKVRAQVNQVAVEKSSNSAPGVDTSSKDALSKEKGEPMQKNIPDPSSISEFMTQVSDLVKLVDSRDIVELQLKQLDCEVLIRKKEALQPVAPPPPPVVTMQQPMPHTMFPPPVPAAPAPPTPAPANLSLPAPSSPASTAKSSHPPLKSPMAGTFYCCPAPGEPPFVKVGDKVQKGQVLCIIEAMKLMNEIEADKSGTIAEILLEDGKPVSADTPLFVIAP
ncbi:hypothetical protein SLA2020_295840 [Shorea laevis]